MIATLLREVLKALVYVHSQWHIHRDVKVMLSHLGFIVSWLCCHLLDLILFANLESNARIEGHLENRSDGKYFETRKF